MPAPPPPVLPDILRQHAEEAAHLWCVYDHALLHPGENEEMDGDRLARVAEALEAHLDGLRIAGAPGREIAAARYAEYPEAGELFVVRMLTPEALHLRLPDLDLDRVRRFLHTELARNGQSG